MLIPAFVIQYLSFQILAISCKFGTFVTCSVKIWSFGDFNNKVLNKGLSMNLINKYVHVHTYRILTKIK